MQERPAQKIVEFMNHVESSVHEMLDSMDVGWEYDEKYDLHLTMNGVTLKLDLHADLYSRLTAMLKDELDELEEDMAKHGIWTPHAMVLCVKCHGPVFKSVEYRDGKFHDRVLSDADMKAMDKPSLLKDGDAITTCDKCGCDIMLSQSIALEHNIVLELQRRGIKAYMDQTGGMNSAAGIATTGDGYCYITHNWDGDGMYVFGRYNHEGEWDEVSEAFDSADDVIKYVMTLEDLIHGGPDTVG